MKKALTIAGSDSGGGAGIQADIKSFSANGVFGMSVITAITAQNTFGVTDVFDLPLSIINAQIDAIFTDMGADAVKTGMLSSPEIVLTVADAVKKYSVKKLVVDPVMVAKGGSQLLREEAVETVKTHLIPLAFVITPNIPEAEVLLGHKIDCFEEAAKELFALGCSNVILKGGHGTGEQSRDLLYDGQEFIYLDAPRVITRNTHGTGCTFASAVAAWLAKGYDITEASFEAKRYITEAIRHADSMHIGGGQGPVNHFFHH